VVLIGFLSECLPLALLTTTHLPLVASALQVISGAGMVVIDVVGMTALQRDLPRETLGRATAIMFGLISGASATLSLIASGLLASVGLTATTVIFGLGFPLLALLGLPSVRRNDRDTAAAVTALEPRIDLLRDLDLFTGAGRQVLERLAQSAEEQHVPSGTVLIKQGDPADALWVLADGTLSVEVDQEGRRFQRPHVQAPGYVGEIGLLRGIPRTATVVAATDCTLLRITGDDFLGALDTSPPSRSLLTISGERFSSTGSAPVGA
jgi:MFS family permease